MKITACQTVNLIARISHDPDVYDVALSHDMVSVVDEDEHIMDIIRGSVIRYTIDEAEELVAALKNAYPNYWVDPYYGQGPALYPVHSTCQGCKIRLKAWKDGISFYRYRLAGEWIYGITNKSTDDPTRYIEASMDGWEKWLDDRKRILKHAWDARYNPTI